jgi:LAS superfamily LD-carboxypeptidase LdcB
MKQLTLIFILNLIIISCQNRSKNTSTPITTKTEIEVVSQPVVNMHLEDTLSITKNFVLGKFNYKVDSTFVKVDLKHATKEIFINTMAYKAFLRMADSAKKEGIDLKILSGTRNYYEQKTIWERKWKKYNNLNPIDRSKKILEYSSMPSTSRHHWGTDIDLNSLNNSYFNTGKGLSVYKWLKSNANRFGFYQVYTNKKTNGRTGYNEEKWHWSYLPLASKYLEYYNSNIEAKDISGFEGSELADKLNVIKEYANGISIKAKDYK